MVVGETRDMKKISQEMLKKGNQNSEVRAVNLDYREKEKNHHYENEKNIECRRIDFSGKN